MYQKDLRFYKQNVQNCKKKDIQTDILVIKPFKVLSMSSLELWTGDIEGTSKRDNKGDMAQMAGYKSK